MGSAVSVSAAAILAVGLTKMRRAEAEKIAQHAGILFIQGEEFFSRSQAALRFHGASVLHFNRGFKAGVDGFAQAHAGNDPWFRRGCEIGRARIPRQESFHSPLPPDNSS